MATRINELTLNYVRFCDISPNGRRKVLSREISKVRLSGVCSIQPFLIVKLLQ